MTRVFLPDHAISYQIAKSLLIDYYIPKMNQDNFTKEAQQRVADYVVEYIESIPIEDTSPRILYFTPSQTVYKEMKERGSKVFNNVITLCDYLNNH